MNDRNRLGPTGLCVSAVVFPLVVSLVIGIVAAGCAEQGVPTIPAPPVPAPAPPPVPGPQPPVAPTGLRVSASGNDFIEWSWSPVAGATGYEVQFRFDGAFTDADQVIDTSGRTVYRREGLAAGTSVFLRVRSYTVAGDDRLESGWSVALPGMTLAPPPPGAPAGLRVSASGEDFVEWSWNPVPGAAGYEVQFRFDGAFTDADEVIDTSGRTVYRREGLAAGTSVFLRVRSYTVAGDDRLESGWSVALPGMTLAPPPPGAPAGLRVSASGEDFVEWSWNPVPGAAGYEVQFRFDGAFTDADEVIDTSGRTVYRREGLAAGTSVFLRVRSYTVAGDDRLESGWSVALPGMTLAPPPPGAPAGLRVSASGEDFVEWSWNPVPGAAGYEVQFRFDGAFTDADEVIDTSGRTVYRREGLAAGTSVFLRVRSYTVAGDDRLRSGWTVALPAMTPAPSPPVSPAKLWVSDTGRDYIEWRWDAVAGAAGYEVQFSLDDAFTEADEVIDTSRQTVYRREGLPAGQSAFLRVRSYTATAGQRLRSGWRGAPPAMTLPPPSPPMTVTGTVRASSGPASVVAGAVVRARNLGTGAVDGEATTDMDGSYAIEGLQGDRYSIEVTPPSGYLSAAPVLVNRPESGDLELSADFSLLYYTLPDGAVTALPAGRLIYKPANFFDLEGKTVTFTPNGDGYAVAVDGPSWEQPGPTATTHQLDGARLRFRVVNLPFSFSFAGATWNRVYANANGHISFQRPERENWPQRAPWPDGTMRSVAAAIDSRSAAGLEAKIAALWAIYGDMTLSVDSTPARVVFSWAATRPTPAYRFHTPLGPNVFQARLYPSGRIELAYRAVAERDGVVGLFRARERTRPHSGRAR